MEIFGYVVYALALLFTSGWILGLRIAAKSGETLASQAVVQTMLFTAALLVPVWIGVSPLHLLWIIPACWVVGMLSPIPPISLLNILARLFDAVVTIGIKRPVWSKLYGEMIHSYISLSGTHAAFSDATGRPFSPHDPMRVIVKKLKPTMDDSQIEKFLNGCEEKYKLFKDENIFRSILKELNPENKSFDDDLIRLKSTMLSEENYNGYFVRYCFGKIFKNDFGEDGEKEFWSAILARKIK